MANAKQQEAWGTTPLIPAVGGTRQITLDAQTTGDIAFDASAADVQAALEGLSNINAGNIAVTDFINNALHQINTNGAGSGSFIYSFTLPSTAVVNCTIDTFTVAGIRASISAQMGAPPLVTDLGGGIFQIEFIDTFAGWVISNPSIGTDTTGYGVTVAVIQKGGDKVGENFEFQGALSNTPIDLMTVNSSLIRAANTIAVSTTQDGVAPSGINEIQKIDLGGATDGAFLLFHVSTGVASFGIFVPCTADSIQAAMDTIFSGTYAAPYTSVTDNLDGTFNVEFIGSLDSRGLQLLAVTDSGGGNGDFTSGGTGVVVSEVQPGVGPVPQPQIVSVANTDVPTQGNEVFTIDGGSPITVAFDIAAADLITATGWGVTGSGTTDDPWLLSAPSNAANVTFTVVDDSGGSPLQKTLDAVISVVQVGTGAGGNAIRDRIVALR